MGGQIDDLVNAITTREITVVSPVDVEGNLTIFRDTNTAITLTITGWTGTSLNGTTGKLRLIETGDWTHIQHYLSHRHVITKPRSKLDSYVSSLN
jgi:hypothetical protein